MEKIYLTARYRLKPEVSKEEFSEFITECIHTVARNCPNTLEYYWYYDPEDREFVMRGKFLDTNAVEHQLEQQKVKILGIREKAHITLELYGNVDDTTHHQFSFLNPKVYHFYQGITKDDGKLIRKAVL